MLFKCCTLYANKFGKLSSGRRSVFIPIPKTGNAKECSSEFTQSCPTLCDPMDCSLHRFLHPWDFPGKNTAVSCHFLLQEIYPTEELNPGLPHCRQTLYHLSHQGSHIEKNYTKKIFMTQIITMVWSLTWSQTSWNVKSSGPWEASLRTKPVEVMKFQKGYFKSWKMMPWKCCTQ